MSERRKRLHELLLALINKEDDFELIEDDTTEFTNNYYEKDTASLSRVISKNRKIIRKYQSLVKSAITLDALMDSENDENQQIQK
ncbi:MAG: hypothetical protein CMK49_01170 [Prochlorococcus sp. SP3034]|nr:hypothetical protein [Prochlorococcus sp. SP3034]